MALKPLFRILFLTFALAACTSGPILTSTPLPAEAVETPSPLPSATNTASPPSATHTTIPTSTPTLIPATLTRTPRATETAVPGTTQSVEDSSTPEVLTCPVLPEGNFASIWQSDLALQAALGCPSSHHPRITPAAWEVATSFQTFERGAMIWSDQIGWYQQPVIYVFYGSSYQRFDDTFNSAADPFNGNETPPAGLWEPSLGFGKVWREQEGVREALGWATAAEVTGTGRFELFVRGEMIWLSQTNQTYVFSNEAGRVTILPIPFE